MANETKINEAFSKKDVATMKSFISEDAVAVDMGGAGLVQELYKQLPTMDVKVTSQALADFKFVWVDANTVVTTYTWTGKGTVSGQPMPSPVFASSVWTKRAGKWVAIFHQETPAPPTGK